MSFVKEYTNLFNEGPKSPKEISCFRFLKEINCIFLIKTHDVRFIIIRNGCLATGVFITEISVLSVFITENFSDKH